MAAWYLYQQSQYRQNWRRRLLRQLPSASLAAHRPKTAHIDEYRAKIHASAIPQLRQTQARIVAHQNHVDLCLQAIMRLQNRPLVAKLCCLLVTSKMYFFASLNCPLYADIRLGIIAALLGSAYR